MFKVSSRYRTKGTCQPQYTYPGFGLEPCPRATSELPESGGEYAQYTATNADGRDNTFQPAGQSDIPTLDSVTGQSFIASSNPDANQLSTPDITQAPFATVDEKLGNWPTVVADDGQGSWGAFNGDKTPGTYQYGQQNTNPDKSAQIVNQVNHLADASQVLSPFPNLGTLASNVNPLGDQGIDSAATSGTTTNQYMTPPNSNLIPNSAPLSPSSTFGGTYLADNNLLGILNNVDTSTSNGGSVANNKEVDNNNYNYGNVLST